MTLIIQRKTIVACFLFFLTPAVMGQDFEAWILEQRKIAINDLLANIEPPDTEPGTVIASPSRDEPDHPNYYFDWVRDGALTMMEIVKFYESAIINSQKDEHLQRILRYVKNARLRQSIDNRSGKAEKHGLGEPKWHVNNTPFNFDWGRPQNDGPALRARTLCYLAQILLREKRHDLVKKLYSTREHGKGVINVDLDFIARHWHEPSYELWEEVNGLHFSTLHEQRRALWAGAELAAKLNDANSATRYKKAASLISLELEKFWDNERGHFIQTHNRVGGLDYKHSNLDASIILSLLDEDDDPFLPTHDDRVLKTAELLRAEMHRKHIVNQQHQFDESGKRMGDGIGRYIEDRYDGLSIGGSGNPWFLITASFAELNYDVAQNFMKDGVIRVTARNIDFLRYALQDTSLSIMLGEVVHKREHRFTHIMHALLVTGDSYLRRWRFHADKSGSTSEQFNGDTGFMQGAKKLTWNCAAFLSAFSEREKLKKMLATNSD